MKPLVVIIEDSGVQRLVTRHEFGTNGVVVPDSPADVIAVELSEVVLIVTDRFMSTDWERARDTLLKALPNAKVVEWTSSAGLECMTDEHKLPRSSATYPKSGNGAELKQLVKESLATGVILRGGI